MNEYDDIARELHAMRAEPRPEYARELDERAGDWLRERPKRRLPSLRIAIPALAGAATAAVVVVLAVSGGDGGSAELEVAVVPDQGATEALGGGAAPQALERDSADRVPEGAFSAAEADRVEAGEPVVVRYFFSAPIEGTIELAGRKETVKVGPGSGRVEISTDGLPTGTHLLEIAFPSMPPVRERIEVGG